MQDRNAGQRAPNWLQRFNLSVVFEKSVRFAGRSVVQARVVASREA